MSHRIIAGNILSRVLFIAVFAASLGVFYLTRTGEGLADFIINLIFAAIAAVFLILYFLGCARPLSRTALALGRVTDDILNSGADQRTLLNRYFQNPAPFENDRLDERYAAYVREVRRLQKQSVLTADCRISDYIDEDVLYAAVNKPFADQLGGIMSGLGVLFTFIGLVYGLRNFNASSVDVMQESTQALMSGIKIAFLTSIFGLIYSLLHGLFYRRLLRDSVEMLHEFQDVYTELVLPTNEHAAENAMLRLQMEQNAAIKGIGGQIGGEVSEALLTLMRPTVDTLQQTISQYVSVAIEDQRAGMERVVHYFMESMNNSLGNIFVQLKNRTEELARWEKDMIDSITSMTTSVGSTSHSLLEAEQHARSIAGTMSAYTESVSRLTTAQTDVIGQMKELLSDYQALHEREEGYLRSLASAADAASANTHASLQAAQSVASIASDIRGANRDSAREIAAAGQKITEAADSLRSMTAAASTDMQNAALRLERTVGDLETGLARSVGDSVSRLDDGIARLNGGLNNVVGMCNSVAQSMKSLPKTVASVDTDIRDTAKSIDAELRLLLRAVSDTQKNLNRFTAELSRRVEL